MNKSGPYIYQYEILLIEMCASSANLVLSNVFHGSPMMTVRRDEGRRN